MARDRYGDLVALLAVAEARRFTKAAARLGGSQSALTQAIRALEERLGLRLLTRRTRSAAAAEAGVRLGEGVARRAAWHEMAPSAARILAAAS